MTRMMEFPGTQIVEDADTANYQNYLAWQAQTAERRRQSLTQFNMFQSKYIERICSHQQFKQESTREVESNKDAVERRLSTACGCESCYRTKSRSSSDAGVSTMSSSSPPSLTDSRRSLDGLTSRSSRSPHGITMEDSTSERSRNNFVTSPPPHNRHHQRRRCSTPDSS